MIEPVENSELRRHMGHLGQGVGHAGPHLTSLLVAGALGYGLGWLTTSYGLFDKVLSGEMARGGQAGGPERHAGRP